MADTDPVPLDGLTEIRIHGVGGSTPASLLDDLAPRQVSGDRVAGFYRTADRRGRHLEAYSWGGLTSRSATRVFWLLLLPFMLANMAGWMARPRQPAPPGMSRPGADPSPLMTITYLWVARLAALAVTVDVVLMGCLAALDVLAYQCGDDPCRQETALLAPFRWSLVSEFPGRRLVLGALLLAVVIGVFALLSYTTRRNYEGVDPPHVAGVPPAGPPPTTAAGLAGGLHHPQFWAGKQAHARLSRYHLSTAIAAVAMILAHCARSVGRAAGPGVRQEWLYWVVLAGGVVVLSAVVVLLRNDSLQRRTWSAWVLAGAGLAVGLSCLFAWLQPAIPDPPTGELPGMRLAFNVTWGFFLALLAPLMIWLATSRRSRVPAPRAERFQVAAPFMVTGFGLIVTNIVLIGGIILEAKLLADEVRWDIVSRPPTGGPAIIYLYPVMQVAITLLALGLIAIVLVAAGFGLTHWIRAGTGSRLVAAASSVADAYRDEPAPPSPPPPPRNVLAWQAKAAPDPTDPTAAETLGWVRGIARWRYLGGITPKVAWVMTFTVSLALLVVGLVVAGFLITGRTPPLLPFGIGVTLAIAIPPALLVLGRLSWKDVTKRRIVGTLWDVGTFFPRSFHPFAPPAYAERAVPELLRRIWYLDDHGGRVLITAHSQGSIVAAAALARESGRNAFGPEPTVKLATFGSPIAKLYRWGFPSLFSTDLLAEIASGTTGIGSVQWRNLYYQTDYIGGATGTAADRPLRDPPTSNYTAGQPLPRVGSHTGYWTDATMWAAIDELADSPP